MFDWRPFTFTGPPFTASLSDDQMRDLILNPLTPPAFPCHTQAVERGFCLVMEAVSSVFGTAECNGFICQRIKSWRKIGRLGTKAKYFQKEFSELSSSSPFGKLGVFFGKHSFIPFWAAAPIGDKVLYNGEIFRPFVRSYVRSYIPPSGPSSQT